MTRFVDPFVLVLLAVPLARIANGQDASGRAELRVVRATSPKVDIQDGHNLRPGFWTISPDVELDVYYAQRSAQAKRIEFRTDVDSIAFVVRPGETHDFVVSLNGKACPTRISTLRESARWNGAGDPSRRGEIPFSIGGDGKLHIQGRINGSAALDLLFDVGADTVVLYPSALAKNARVELDGSVMNSGLGGEELRRTSNENRLELSNLTWEHELVMEIETQADDADGVVGFNVFEDKVVELDYGRSLMTIHDVAPAQLAGYVQSEMRFQGTLPHVEATLGDGAHTFRGWFAFDTGFNGSVYVNRELASGAAFLDGLDLLGTNRSRGVGKESIEGAFFLLPELTVAEHVLRGVPISVETSEEGAHHSTSLLGMEVLARFDTLLDFQQNVVWWKPNASAGAPFARRGGSRAAKFAVGFAAVLALAGLVVWKRRRASEARAAA